MGAVRSGDRGSKIVCRATFEITRQFLVVVVAYRAKRQSRGMRTKDEMLRRLRLGNIKTLLRWRCGPELIDDDAGREYLHELLLPVSLGPEPHLKMTNIMEVWAPWMDAKERFELVAAIEQTPAHVRKITAKALGERLRVTSQERAALRLWTIAAHDATDEQRI